MCANNMIPWTRLTLFYIIFVTSKAEYIAMFQDGVSDCEDYVNSEIDYSQVSIVHRSGDESYITGNVTFNTDIVEGATIEVKMYKDVDGNMEYRLGITGDICSQLKNEECLWYEIMNNLGITECPIKKGRYELKRCAVDISNFERMMKNEHCGDYMIQVMMNQMSPEKELLNPTELDTTMSCHEFYTTVLERN